MVTKPNSFHISHTRKLRHEFLSAAHYYGWVVIDEYTSNDKSSHYITIDTPTGRYLVRVSAHGGRLTPPPRSTKPDISVSPSETTLKQAIAYISEGKLPSLEDQKLLNKTLFKKSVPTDD